MASEVLREEELCPECGKLVDIYNGNFQFSLELHLQSHKPLETINHEIEMESRRNPGLQSVNSNLDDVSSHESKDVGYTNNVPLTLGQNPVKENPGSLGIESGGQSIKSKRKRKKKLTDTQDNSTFLATPIDILSDIFSSLPSELKAHEGFFTRNNKGTLLCKICKVTVQPIVSVTEHLKTRLHEDRTIKYFKDSLSNEFHHIMEFVSFNNSNLCCNLCRFNFDLCPNNPKETTFSIMKHNLSKEHLERNTRNKSFCFSDLGSVMIRSLSQLNQIINDNQQCLEFKMQLEFRCKLCNVVVGCDINETSLYKLFIDHFMSEGHINSKAASELETNNALNINGKQTHHFTTTKDNIYCSVSNCYGKSKVQALTCHVKQMPLSKIPYAVSSVENTQAQSFLTSIQNIELTTNDFKNSDRPSTSTGRDSQENQSGNPECLPNPVPQQSNITHSVDEPKVEALTCHVKQMPSSEIPYAVSSVENAHAQSFLTSIQNIEPTTNDFKNSDHPSISPGRDSQGNRSGNPECLPNPVPQKSNITHSVDEPKVLALTCHVKQMPSSEIPYAVSSVENTQTQSFLTSRETTQLTPNNIKNSDDPSNLQERDSQANQSGNPDCLPNPVPQQSNITYHKINDMDKFDPYTNYSEHLSESQKKSLLFISPRSKKTLYCSWCQQIISAHYFYLNEHLFSSSHKMAI